jgi:hypothetical protein
MTTICRPASDTGHAIMAQDTQDLTYPRRQATPAAYPRSAWLLVSQRTRETAKRAYPTLIVLAIFAILFVATVAIRIAIWRAAFHN